MARVAGIIKLAVTYVQALFYGLLVSLELVRGFLQYGSKFFSTNPNRTEPPCLSDRSLGEHKFMHVRREENGGQGIRIHYVIKGDVQKPLMVLVHGFPEIWYSWRHQIAEFSKDYCVVAIDLRGYGKSDKPIGVENYSMDHLVRDITAIIEGLGRRSAILVGHDWGAIICWVTATLHPEVVDKLIIMNGPHPAAIAKLLRSSLKQLRLSWYVSFFQLPYLPELHFSTRDYHSLSIAMKTTNDGRTSKEDLESVKYSLQDSNGVSAPINYYRALFSYPTRLPKRMLRMPVLILWGTADLALCTEVAALSCAYCEDVTLKLLEGMSHYVQRDDPDTVNKHMWEFLKQ